jgi:hypothetical protein
MRTIVLSVCMLALNFGTAHAVSTDLFFSWAASYNAIRFKEQPPAPDVKVQEIRRQFAERFVAYVAGVRDTMGSPYARRTGDYSAASCVPATVTDEQLADFVVKEIAKQVDDIRKANSPAMAVAVLISARYPYPCKSTDSSSIARWVKVSESPKYDSYADNTTLSRSGDLAKVWILAEIKVAETLAGRPVRSSKTQYEVECRRRGVRSLATTYYDGHGGRGRVIHSTGAETDWGGVPPDTLIEAVHDFACRAR